MPHPYLYVSLDEVVVRTAHTAGATGHAKVADFFTAPVHTIMNRFMTARPAMVHLLKTGSTKKTCFTQASRPTLALYRHVGWSPSACDYAELPLTLKVEEAKTPSYRIQLCNVWKVN
jgi:hypothetical protein